MHFDNMRHLISIDDLSAQDITNLVRDARQLKTGGLLPALSHAPILTTLFYENSTRTLMSFRVAAQRLGLVFFPLTMQQSSAQKGETLLDTLRTLHAMDIQLCIIRHPASGILETVRSFVPDHLQLLNAGDGQNEHPSQALLDWMTILERVADPTRLKIAIVGDVRHSRVAHSFQKICKRFGVTNVVYVAPPIWQPEAVVVGETTDCLADGLVDADVVITLRVQQERLAPEEHYCLTEYFHTYGLTPDTLKLAKPTAIVMHPGPMNRGIEISDAVADGPQSCVLQQVANGVWMRMAILRAMLLN